VDGLESLKREIIMGRFFRWAAILTVLFLFAGGAYVFGHVVPDTDAKMNAVRDHAPYVISPEAQALHDSIDVADLHADTLLWKRDPAKRHDRGQVDLPRLREGGVKLQIFSATTKSPDGQNFDGNDADAADQITKLAQAQLWPLRTWNSIYERAAYQAQRLQKLEANKNNKFIIARTVSDLVQPDDVVIGLLLTEGSHPLEGKLENIDRLYDEGYRIMGLQHFFDNKLGGSLHGRSQSGLTDFGRAAVTAMTEKDIIIDVAHSSEATVRDVLSITDAPLMLSHGGVVSHCPRTKNRNLPDDILIEMANRGSLVGIGYFQGVICDITPKGIAAAIDHAVVVLGPEAVALGSDFDGTVETTLDTSELAAITQALMDRGMNEDIIRKVMGENAFTFLSLNLPE